MRDSEPDVSPVARNRFAVATVLCVGAALVVLGTLQRFGLLESLTPTAGPTAESVPLYFLFSLLFVATVVWSVVRVFSLLE